MPRCNLRFERALYRDGAERVVGIDEAGRGPLAGPVVAAAVMLPRKFSLPGLTDSKMLSPQLREEFFQVLTTNTLIEYGLGIASVAEIDGMNILRASYLAMERAVSALHAQPGHLLIDGLAVPVFAMPQTAIVCGDAKSLSIAAASVIAKVTRDRMMQDWHEEFPVYQFRHNKGYGTPEHLESLRLHGPCSLHRRSFAPVAQTHFPFA